ncbi:MAG: CPBP family intramembrane glutamic endopeptidase [Haloarculaceae archaeon]
MSVRLARRFHSLSWVRRSLLVGGVLFVVWESVTKNPSLAVRATRDALLFIVVPLALAAAYGRHIGWRVDRTAVRNTLLLTLFVFPFYLVGSSLPSIRSYYPMWETSTALGEFLPHFAFQFVVALAAETYFRGLLCVGVRDLGRKAIFISPLLYAVHHIHKPPIEIVLSGPTDVLFGFVDYESNSILPSVVAHGIGLNFLDWLVLHDPVVPPERAVSWLSWLPVGL